MAFFTVVGGCCAVGIPVANSLIGGGISQVAVGITKCEEGDKASGSVVSFGSYQTGNVCWTLEPSKYSTPPSLDDHKLTELFQKTWTNKSAKWSTLAPTDWKVNCEDGQWTLEPEKASKWDHVGLCSGKNKSTPQWITVETKENNYSNPIIEVCTGACFQARTGQESESPKKLDPNRKAWNWYPIQFKIKSN